MTKDEISKDSQLAFWSKVIIGKASDCWPWAGARSPAGYGNVRVNKAYRGAHRISWILAHFPIPDGYVVCHSCDNPPCCNPAHLMLAKPSANMKDMITKSRDGFRKNRAIGTRNTNAKLSDSAVKDIIRRYTAKEADQYQLAREYSVSQTTIGSVVRRATWRHVDV
jgi:hypothetical protein